MMRILLSFLFFLFTIFAENGCLAIRPYYTKGEIAIEKEAINVGRAEVRAEYESFSKRKPLLCSTFLNSSKPDSVQGLNNNLKVSMNFCDWAVILYAGDNGVCHDTSFSTIIVHCNHSMALFQYPTLYEQFGLIPKPLFYFDLLPVLPNYQYVLIIDEDIGLKDIDFKLYESLLHCAFYPNPAPLISQGLINTDIQAFSFLRPSRWEGTGIIASETILVEQQMPYFNSMFFKWFVKYVLEKTIPYLLHTGSTWGTDSTWCGAAYAFGTELLNYNRSDYVPCAIMIATPHYLHYDYRTIAAKRKNMTDFVNRGVKMTRYYSKLFPSWNINHLISLNATHPLHPETILQHVYNISMHCPSFPYVNQSVYSFQHPINPQSLEENWSHFEKKHGHGHSHGQHVVHPKG